MNTLASLFLILAALLGQAEPGARVEIRGVDDRAFPTITVDYEVQGPDGSPVLDAVQSSFSVFESGRPRPILTFQAPSSIEVRPTTVVLVVDQSESMKLENRIGSLKEAVSTFLEVMPPGSRVAVVAFSDAVRPLVPFTDDVETVREAVNRLRPRGQTRFYDAVAEALDQLADQPGRRAVLALTDGEDTASREFEIESVIALARRLGLPVHTVGVGSEDEIASDDLQALASGTRGQYYPARRADELRAIYEELARRLGNTYTLSYRTDRQIPDGTLRPVQIAYQPKDRPAEAVSVGEAQVFIKGMVVPADGWSGLFILLTGLLGFLLLLPSWLRTRPAARPDGADRT